MKKKITLKEIEKRAESLGSCKSAKKEQDSHYYLFISFDLVNFTKLKLLNSKWAKLLVFFYKHLATIVLSDTTVPGPGTGVVWKLRGDEVILRWRITDIASIPHIILSALENSTKVEKASEIEFKIPVRVKLTTWIIKTFPKDNSNEQIDNSSTGNTNKKTNGENNIINNNDKDKNKKPMLWNIAFATENFMANEYWDFVGPQMDAGFRLTGHSLPGVIVLSVELVYILSKMKNKYKYDVWGTPDAHKKAGTIIDGMKTVALQKLKGVGHGAPYPIIWYSMKWNDTKNQYYLSAENFEHTLLKTLVSTPRNKNPIEKDIYKQTLYYKNINEDTDYIDGLISKKHTVIPEDKEPTLVHFAIILFVEINGIKKIVLRKRPDDKEIYPGRYDFGSAKITRHGESFQNAILLEYIADMKIEVKVCIEKDQPIAVFNIPHKKNECGILYAKIVSNKDAEKIETEWLHDLDNVEKMSEDDLVPRAKINIQRARELLPF